jgi:hypothetical protein
MSTEYRALGTIIEFTTATDIGLTVTFTGTGSATINSSTLAYYQIAANTKWRLPDLLQHLTERISSWIVAAVNEAGAPAGTAAPTVQLNFTPSITSNGSLCSISISCTGVTVGGTSAPITAATLINTNGLWSKLGFAQEGTTPITLTVSTGTATKTGVFQPRSIFVFLRSEVDEGNTETMQNYKALRLNDGTGSVFYSGRNTTRRRLSLIDLDENTCGRDVPLMRLQSINADRLTLEYDNTVESTYSTPITGVGYQGDLIATALTDGCYISVSGQWVGRLFDSEAGPPQTLVLYEKVPSSITAPTNCVVTRISDVHALWFEAVRTGYLCVFDMVEEPGADFGKVRWLSQEYMLSEESKAFAPDRRDISAPLYSYTFDLIRRDANDLESVS